DGENDRTDARGARALPGAREPGGRAQSKQTLELFPFTRARTLVSIPSRKGGTRMKFLAAIAGVLLLQGTIVRAQPTQQCSVQSDYPSPLDADGQPIGALVQVSLSSQVGVVLDDLPAAKRADVAQWLLSQGTDYWKARVIRQLTLAYYRLNFRNYYVSNQGALPLPDPSLWTFSFGTARRAPFVSGKKKSVVDAVFVDYQMQTVILTD